MATGTAIWSLVSDLPSCNHDNRPPTNITLYFVSDSCLIFAAFLSLISHDRLFAEIQTYHIDAVKEWHKIVSLARDATVWFLLTVVFVLLFLASTRSFARNKHD